MTTCFRAAFTTHRICPPDSMRESFVAGFGRSVSTRARTELIRCGVRSITDLSTHKESAGGTAAARSYELESTVRYLGIEVDDALEVSEQTEV
jgi:hypothetical protein